MKKCFLCGLNDSVLDFDEDTFQNCYLKLQFRKEKKYLYGKVELPLEGVKKYGYHSPCYKKVTALSKKYKKEFTEFCKNHDVSTLPASPGEQVSPNCSQVSDKICCIFCNHSRNRNVRRPTVLYPKSDTLIAEIKEFALKYHDYNVLEKLENQVFAYHSDCLSAYKIRMKRQSEEQVSSDWREDRELHQLAFTALATFIEEEIISNHKIMYLTQLLNRYKALLLDFAEGRKFPEDFALYRCEYLEKKLVKVFGDRLAIDTCTGRPNSKIVYRNDIDISILASQSLNLEKKVDARFQEVAYDLRNCVKSIPCRKLPNRLTVDDVINGECDIPEQLYEFMYNLIVRPNSANVDMNQITVKVKSLCSDIIFITTKGRVKPAKNLNLGLALKSLTNSRQVLTILNRYGHTIGYNLVEELETEMTYTAVEQNSIIPSGIKAAPGRSTHVAFDNFDRFVDTTSGKDTMHDTVGIIYQFHEDSGNIEADESLALQRFEDIDQTTPPLRKRRRFNLSSNEVRPYYQKPTATMEFLSVNYIEESIVECQRARNVAIEMDLLWMISLARSQSVPMWLGYNCMVATDKSEVQTVQYLSPINFSPTSYAVVNETLIMAKEIASTCNEEFIIVTYDLAIAKMAMQIQRNESPKFDNIFINLGAFHTQMAFFKAIGKYIDSSGLVDVLVQSEVLAGGSANSFLDSKHFNRCKRIHPLASVALQILHFEQYLSMHESNLDMLHAELQIIKDQVVDSDGQKINLPDYLRTIIDGYEEFWRKTLGGEYGRTAQYCLQYCELVNLFLRFSRSIRNSDFELYVDSIYNMSDLFFSLNQPNYARWSIMYVNNLIKAQNTNSTLVSEFRRGAFGIRRTKSAFSRSPVDLTLEQTINADASKQLTFNLTAESISARQRWALSHSIRTKIISTVKENVGITQKDDTCRSLQRSKIKKDNENLESIVETIRNTLNPFCQDVDKSVLFNISTGKAASPGVCDFLINVKSIGKEQKLAFISECNLSAERFEKPIKRNKILNFASQSVYKAQTNNVTNKRALLKMERDIFGRLLAISIEHNISLECCLTFPLAPVPPALFSYAGDLLKTDKSKLAKALKCNVKTIEPTGIDIEIIDGFYYLYVIGSSLPQTFDKVAESILLKICSSNAPEIHMIFDRYLTHSIKQFERQSRQEFDAPYTIQGPLQPRPSDFLKSLKNYRFKEALVQFLSVYWENDYLASIIQNKKIYITVGEKCFSYHAVGNCVVKNEEMQFSCQHEEADTRIMFHIYKSPPNSKILVKANDTDVLVILLPNIQTVPNTQIWLASTISKKNKTDFDCINCTELAFKLGPTLCLGLPAFHAFTGCDYTAAFYNKGKIKPFKIFQARTDFQTIFASLTDPLDVLVKEKIECVEEFTSLIYGIKHCTSVNDARYCIFQKTYAINQDKEHFMKKVKGIDSNLIPPCWMSLKEKMLRTIFVNSVWLHATDSCCVKLIPEDCGWFFDGYLKPTTFIGEPTPLKVEEILTVLQENQSETESEGDCYACTSDESESE